MKTHPLHLIALILTLTCSTSAPAQEPDQKEASLSLDTVLLVLRAKALDTRATRHYQQGDYAEAEADLKELLEIVKRLYPAEQHPNGHEKTATALNNVGTLLWSQGKYSEAKEYFSLALEMRRNLHPEEKQHSSLAGSLSSLANAHAALGEYGEARNCYQEALEIYRRNFPNGHPHFAMALNSFGSVLDSLGEYAAARTCLEQGLEMRRSLYPKEKYRNGHVELAKSLINLGRLLDTQGESKIAIECYLEASQMLHRLHPRGHPILATCLNNIGFWRRAEGNHAEALKYYQQALEMRGKFYPEGHADLAQSLNNVGFLFGLLGDYGEAARHLQQALEMRKRIYPTDKYPRGHRDLVETLNNLGFLATQQKDYSRAREFYEQGLAMLRKVFPETEYPHGHLGLVAGMNSLGMILYLQNEPVAACQQLEEAAAMEYELAEFFINSASEAEALNFLAQHPPVVHTLLSLPESHRSPDDELYSHVWRQRGVVQRVVSARQKLWWSLESNEARELLRRYVETRRSLAALTLASAQLDSKRTTDRAKRLRELGDMKESLERNLTKLIPDFHQRFQLSLNTHKKLLEKLDGETALVDVLRFKQEPSITETEGDNAAYVAFILLRGTPVKRVDLGPVGAIDAAVKAFREDIVERRSHSPAANRLRTLVWEHLEPNFPPGVKTVYICPAGALTGLPWIALPGRKPDSFLIEQYRLAVLPHAQFLLDPSSGIEHSVANRGKALLVGGVTYNARPVAIADARPDSDNLGVLARTHLSTATRAGAEKHWTYLAGTKKEVAAIRQIAKNNGIPTSQLSGLTANTEAIVRGLSGSRFAHLATHGFFADPRIRSHSQVHEESLPPQPFFMVGERTTIAGRNPLTLSGLVLAGANLPPPTDTWGVPQGDGGILTAERISPMNLAQLDLAVLSACETGLGDVAAGEGVYGLQRAFHTAGCKNVVASLWKIDDAATQQLMTLFYENLWQKKLTPLEALRQAQLAMLLKYEPSTSRMRSGFVNNSVDEKAIEDAREKLLSARKEKLSPFYWASFNLSGAGR